MDSCLDLELSRMPFSDAGCCIKDHQAKGMCENMFFLVILLVPCVPRPDILDTLIVPSFSWAWFCFVHWFSCFWSLYYCSCQRHFCWNRFVMIDFCMMKHVTSLTKSSCACKERFFTDAESTARKLQNHKTQRSHQ